MVSHQTAASKHQQGCDQGDDMVNHGFSAENQSLWAVTLLTFTKYK